MRGCHRLTYLSLYSNKLEGAIPTWVSELEGLLELNLNFNKFTGYVPRSAHEMYSKKQKRLDRAHRITAEDRARSKAAQSCSRCAPGRSLLSLRSPRHRRAASKSATSRVR